MQLINLTGEDIKLIHPETNDEIVLEGTLHRANTNKGSIHLNSIRVDGGLVLETENYYTKVKGLPEPKDGIIYIVLPEVLKAEPIRRDLRMVNEPLYDSEDNLIGYQSITKFYK